VYLLHPLLVEVYYHLPWVPGHHPLWLQLLLAAAFGIVSIAVSSATYLAVERPMQNVGRRVARWLDHRFGRDRMPARAEPVLPGRALAAVGMFGRKE
jgi:peptidoglycan/LPS O-acetylase OafA/YrhL